MQRTHSSVHNTFAANKNRATSFSTPQTQHTHFIYFIMDNSLGEGKQPFARQVLLPELHRTTKYNTQTEQLAVFKALYMNLRGKSQKNKIQLNWLIDFLLVNGSAQTLCDYKLKNCSI